MSLSLTQNLTAIAANMLASFLAIGGTAPYTYSVIGGGAGGTINSSTGQYTAPAIASSSPNQAYDTVQVVDSTSSVATAQILVGTPLILFCDIIQTGLGLASGRVYLWNQKLMQPIDNSIYIAISVPSCKPFGVGNQSVNGMQSQAVNMQASVDIDIISRGPAARDQKELVILALSSVYAEQQQEANSFYISQLPSAFIDLSHIDGAAIPYRYRISCKIIYCVTQTQSEAYFNTFASPTVYTNP